MTGQEEQNDANESSVKSVISTIGIDKEDFPLETEIIRTIVESRDCDEEEIIFGGSSSELVYSSTDLYSIDGVDETDIDEDDIESSGQLGFPEQDAATRYILSSKQHQIHKTDTTDDEASFYSDDVTVQHGSCPHQSVSRSQVQQQTIPARTRTVQERQSHLPRIHPSVLLEPDDDEYERKSHLCCVFCCDLVQAVIIVDCIDLVVAIAIVIISLTGFEQVFVDAIDFSVFRDFQTDSMDDDEAVASLSENRRVFAIVTVLTGLGVVFSTIGIYGACKFQPYLVLLAGIWFGVDVVRGLATKQWLNALIAGLFVYPHVGLYLALKGGTITKDNYKNEKHCCCQHHCEDMPELHA